MFLSPQLVEENNLSDEGEIQREQYLHIQEEKQMELAGYKY